MTARQIRIYQELTGQSALTLRYMQITTNLNDRRIMRRYTSTERGIRWANRFFNYPVTQLMDLSPNSTTTNQFPFDGQPPPNLLIGYFYFAKVINQYLFDQRTFSNISYEIALNRVDRSRCMIWRILTDSTYTVNTGSYSRAIYETDEFSETIHQIQNAIVMDRIITSVQDAEQEIHGFGMAIQNQHMNRIANINSHSNFHKLYYYATASNNDTEILRQICMTKRALYNFCKLSEKENVNSIFDSPYTDGWLRTFVDTMSAITDYGEATLKNIKEMAVIMTMGKGSLHGGALTLRSGTRVGLPFRLRQRDRGQAITETIARNRGRAIRHFIDNLPITRRRRPAADVGDAVDNNPPYQPTEPVEVPGPSDRREVGLSRQEYNEEIIATIVDLLQNLEDELSQSARSSNFFDFVQQFYELFVRMLNRDEATPRFIRRWLVNFFIVEHIASTLFYLYMKLYRHRNSRNNLSLSFAQVILRARNENGEELYTRVWHDSSRNPFRILYRRIRHDFVTISENSDRDMMFQVPEERDQLLQDINFIENSGDVEEIFNQIRINDIDVESVEISFRIKISGNVGYSTNSTILDTFDATRSRAIQTWRRSQAL
ncbi:pTP [Barthadenovirus sternae]|nr:pTP [Tern atadenovirus 1]